VISALPLYLNLTNISFLDGKHLVEVSRILFFSGENKLFDVLAQAIHNCQVIYYPNNNGLFNALLQIQISNTIFKIILLRMEG
jgi:hypothetical protein